MKEYIVGIENEHSYALDVCYKKELIRCEECKYFCAEQVEYDTPYGFTNFNWVCWCDKHTDYDNQKYLEVHTDDYCSWAERKDNDTDRMDNQS